MSSTKPVFVLCDSRGLGLQEHLDSIKPHAYVVRSVSSAGLVMVATKHLTELIKIQPEYVIIAVGICEVTMKNKRTKKYTLKYTDIDDTVKAYEEAIVDCRSLILDVLPNTKVIFNPVTGLDLEDYNSKLRKGLTGDALKKYHEEKPINPLQSLLNSSVISINQKIANVNHTNYVATPWSASLVHKSEKGGKYYHHYQYLSDGCHLLDKCQAFWAQKFHIAIEKSIMINNKV